MPVGLGLRGGVLSPYCGQAAGQVPPPWVEVVPSWLQGCRATDAEAGRYLGRWLASLSSVWVLVLVLVVVQCSGAWFEVAEARPYAPGRCARAGRTGTAIAEQRVSVGIGCTIFLYQACSGQRQACVLQAGVGTLGNGRRLPGLLAWCVSNRCRLVVGRCRRYCGGIQAPPRGSGCLS